MPLSRRFIACICTLSLIILLLSACASAPFAELTLDGNIICRVWGSEQGLRRLEVISPGGETERFSLPRIQIEPSPTGGLEQIDLNFDGHDDLRILSKVYREGERRYLCFLWQEDGLTRSPALEQLYLPEPDAETKTITAWQSYVVAEERESRARVTYVWHTTTVGTTLVPVAKTELLYYPEEEIYCLAHYTATPGHPLALTDERWIWPEQLNEEEIWNESENTTP